VRGGAAVDLQWKDGKVTSLQLHATGNGAVRLIPPAGQAIARVITAEGQTISVGADGILHLKAGSSCGVTFR
jgi:alpha-L-fucosidase 2